MSFGKSIPDPAPILRPHCTLHHSPVFPPEKVAPFSRVSARKSCTILPKFKLFFAQNRQIFGPLVRSSFGNWLRMSSPPPTSSDFCSDTNKNVLTYARARIIYYIFLYFPFVKGKLKEYNTSIKKYIRESFIFP